jgi:hypothetical protein
LIKIYVILEISTFSKRENLIMSRRRFGDLEERLLTYLQSGGAVAQIQDRALKKYAEWKFNVGGNERNLPDTSVRNRQGLKYAIIKPFGRTNSDMLVYVSVSNRAYEWANEQNAVKVELKWQALPAANATNLPNLIKGFSPAQAVFRQQATSTISRVSRITGKTYKTKSGSSQQGYVLPFGSTVATEKEIERSRIIANAKPNNFSVSFKSENYVNTPDVIAFT